MLSKYQSNKEKLIIKEMTERYSRLTELDRAELLRLKCRNELLSFMVILSGKEFKPYPVHRLVIDFVEKCANGEDNHDYIAVSLPPRTGKSTIISRYLPAFQLGRNPISNHIIASHSLDLCQKSIGVTLEIMSSPIYKKIFPETKLPSKGVTTVKFKTTKGGELRSATPKTKVSGFDAGTMEHTHFPGLIILDDLLSKGSSPAELETAWNLVVTEILTRGLPNKSFISMGTRYNISDVTGRLLESAPELWKLLNVPALCMDPVTDPLKRQLGESHWEEKFPAKDLITIRQIQDEELFNTIYQGIPAGSKGNYVLIDDLIYVDHLLEGYYFFSIDTALKGKEISDYNCVCIWKKVLGTQSIQLVDVLYQKSDFYRLLVDLRKLTDYYKPRHIVIETKASGDSLSSMLEQEYPNINIHGHNPKVDKIGRLQLAAPSVKRGAVVIYKNITNWEELEKQLTTFPYSRNDDFVDAFSLGINFFNEIMSAGDFDGPNVSLLYGLSVHQQKAPIDTSIIRESDKSYYSESANNYYRKYPEKVENFL